MISPGRGCGCLIVLLLVLAASRASVVAQDFSPKNTQANGQEPLAATDAMKRLRVPPGFEITLAAAEPDVQQPIAMTFDDRGRLWIAESYSYDGSQFTDEPNDRILIFEDTTGDGVLDRRRVFCDGLTHLTGLEIGFGGVWITAPPSLAFIPDHDSDDRPDGDPLVHLNGWSTKAEHNSVNGLTWGPDGWLYGRHGIKQPSLVGRPGSMASERVELSCCIWRYHPTQNVFEVVADGTINPWGLDFDDHGHGFLTTSVVEHLWHLVPGAHYERWKDRGVNPNRFAYEAMTATSDHLHWGSTRSDGPAEAGDAGNAGSGGPVSETWDKAGRMADGNQQAGGGHSHCDAMIYLGDRWPDKYRGSLLTSNIHGRRINQDRLKRDGGPFRGVHDEDFLVADDPWFRAVSMEYGPDGDVYLTDWSDNGECHDRDGVHRTSGRIYKVTWGNPVRVDVNLQQATLGQLVEYQLHDNDWFVRHARRILQERAASGLDVAAAHTALESIFETNPNVTRKLRAMWALHCSGGLSDKWLKRQLDHTSEHVRAWAIRLLVDRDEPSRAALTQLVQLAKVESSWLVQMSIASALRRVDPTQRWPVIANLAPRIDPDHSANLERMIWYAMEPAVAAMPSNALQAAANVSPNLRRWIARRITECSDPHVEKLFAVLGETERTDAIVDLLRGLGDGLSHLKTDQLPATAGETISHFLVHEDLNVRIAAVMIAAAIGNDKTLADVRRLLHDESTDLVTARAALAGIVQRKPKSLADDLKRLIKADRLTIPAIQATTSIKDPTLGKMVLDRYPNFSSSERIVAIDSLVARRQSAERLIDAMEQQSIAATDLSAGQARQIVDLGDAVLLNRLELIWGSVRPTSADRLKQIKTWEQKLTPSLLAKADLANGRDLFKKTCGTCHKLFGEGQSTGPELTGANRDNLQYLLSNVIDPSAAVPADFRLAIILTTDGRVVSGAILQRTDLELAVQTTTETIKLKSDEIESIKISSQSLMPDGLLDKLDDAQIRDLFAWIMNGDRFAQIPPEPDTTGGKPVVILLGDSTQMNDQKTFNNDLFAISDRVGRDETLRASDGIHLFDLGEIVLGRRVANAIASIVNTPATGITPLNETHPR